MHNTVLLRTYWENKQNSEFNLEGGFNFTTLEDDSLENPDEQKLGEEGFQCETL